MAKKPTCFIISPIGDAGSTTRENADDLLQMIIEPALEIYDFRITRGDHRNDNGQIDADVIRSVQESDLCICDLSEENINVYYELGRRDETGKPIVLMKRLGAGTLPVDIATRRYIEYDLDSRHGPRDAQKKLRESVEPFVEAGFETADKVTLDQLEVILSRIERKVDRLESSGGTVGRGGNGGGGTGTVTGKSRDELLQDYKLALIQRDPAGAEAAMFGLQKLIERNKWLDVFVEQAAALGSTAAGKILLDSAQEFMDSDMTYHKKMEYLGVLVTYISRADLEPDYWQIIDGYAQALMVDDDNEEEDDRISVRNQPQRLYYGMYMATKNIEWLYKCEERLKKCLQIGERDFLCYNLAMVVRKLAEVGDEEYRVDRLEQAKAYIDRCLEIEDEEDDDHLELACRIYYALGLPELEDLLSRLEQVNSTSAILLRRDLKD